jgi:MFS family permease
MSQHAAAEGAVGRHHRNPMLHTLLTLRGNPRACVWTEPMWGLSMALVLPYASVYMLALGLHDEQIGLLASIGVLSQVVFGLLGGVITDKLGRRATTAVFDVVAWSIPCLIWAVAQNFWYFLVAALINGAWQVTQNSWDCLMVEDVDRRLIPRVYALVRVAGDFAALFAPIAALVVSRYGLVPAVRILYVNAFVVMTVKLIILYRWSTETAQGRVRREETRGVPFWTLIAGYRGVIGTAMRSRGTLLSLVVAALVGAVALINGTFWQVVISTRLGVPDPLLPFFPMVRSLLSVALVFTVFPRYTHAARLQRPTQAAFLVALAGQALFVLVPAAGGRADATTYALLAVCLLLDAFGAGLLFMLSESLVALHVDRAERSRVMALQRTAIMLATVPFGWLSGWLSGVDRRLPFVLTCGLLVVGFGVVTWFWAATHADDEPAGEPAVVIPPPEPGA